MLTYPEKRALVVDDDEQYLERISAILMSEGLECSRLYTGENATLFLETLSFRLLIVEEHLSGMSGLEVAVITRKLHPSIPIIITTSSATAVGIREAALIGAFEYAIKPFDSSWMRGKISQSLMKSFIPPKSQVKRSGRATIPSSPARRSLQRTSLEIIVIEFDDNIRRKILEVAANIGCKVSAFKTVEKATIQSRTVGCDVFIANPMIIGSGALQTLTTNDRLPFETVIIVDNEDRIHKTEAASLGAKGFISLNSKTKHMEIMLKKIISTMII